MHLMKNLKLPAVPLPKIGSSMIVVPIPKSIDWRTGSQVITPIRNQGACGSCWTFSTTDAISSTQAIQNKWSNAFMYSAEQVVDCAY